MTEAERTLLLALARYMLPAEPHKSVSAGHPRLALWTALKRVEFEAEQPPEAR